MLIDMTRCTRNGIDVSYSFKMLADGLDEKKALDRLISDYDKCIDAINDRFDDNPPKPVGMCECCGKPGKAYRFKIEDGSTKGPYVYCDVCVPRVGNIEEIE